MGAGIPNRRLRKVNEQSDWELWVEMPRGADAWFAWFDSIIRGRSLGSGSTEIGGEKFEPVGLAMVIEASRQGRRGAFPVVVYGGDSLKEEVCGGCGLKKGVLTGRKFLCLNAGAGRKFLR